LRAFVTHVSTKRDLALAIPSDQGGRRPALFERWHEAMRSTAASLLNHAQANGTVSADLNASDLLAMASGIALSSTDADQAERCLAILRHGTTPQPRTPS
jgi:hypothetical protein